MDIDILGAMYEQKRLDRVTEGASLGTHLPCSGAAVTLRFPSTVTGNKNLSIKPFRPSPEFSRGNRSQRKRPKGSRSKRGHITNSTDTLVTLSSAATIRDQQRLSFLGIDVSKDPERC